MTQHSALSTQHYEVLSRARAAFIGVAVGDAFGATTEFMTPAEIRSRFGVHRKIVGGGWLHLKSGRVTDDTEMSLCLARAILQNSGWDLKAAAEAFLAWMRSKPVDIGSTVRRGIRDYLLKGQLETPPNDWDAGNGAVMRMIPVALYTLGDDEFLQKMVVAQAHLTHNHPFSDAACITVGRMVQAALLGADRFALHALARQLVVQHPTFRFKDYSGRASGYVVETMQTVLHFLFTTGSFEECLVGVVNQGGDADTTGAIAGMIAGALYGEAAIPAQWLKRLDPQVLREVAAAAEELVRQSPYCQTAEKEQIMKGDSHDVAGWTPVAEAAQIMGTTPLNVLMHIKRGLLVGREQEGGWLVDPESLATLLSKRAAGELPAVCQGGCSKNHGCPSCG